MNANIRFPVRINSAALPLAVSFLLVLPACRQRESASSNSSASSGHGESAKNIVTLTKNNFQSEVLSSPQPVLVDFWAVWCGPCKIVAPVVAELASEYAGKVKVGKVNVDDEPSLSEQYKIDGIPAILIFKDGKLVDQSVGVRSKADYQARLNKVLGTGAAKSTP